MKRKTRVRLGALALLAACAGTASATPLRLDYCKSDIGGGQFRYSFRLTLDNNDGTWVPGNGFDWFIFGDAVYPGPSLMADFVGDSTWLPVGPWTNFTSSGGGHNGPTFGPVTNAYWIPIAVGDYLVWEGTSSANLGQGQMLFSSLINTGGAVAPDFEVAHLLTGGCIGPTGACCRTDGTCIVTTNGICTNQNGIYRGDASVCATANCAPGGRCCQALGVCSILTSAACQAAGGTYGGDNSECGTGVCPGGFALNCTIPGTFTDISSSGNALSLNNPDDGNASFTSSVTNVLVSSANLFVCSNGFITNTGSFVEYENRTLPVSAAGLNFGLYPNWDDLYVDGPGQIFEKASNEGGIPVHIIQWNQVRTYAAGEGGTPGTFEVKIWRAGGPALVQFLYQNMSWDGNGDSSTVGAQWAASTAFMSSYNVPGSIADGGVCSIVQVGGPSVCYVNCDHSTGNPALNANDFQCFLNAYAVAVTLPPDQQVTHYVNCDHSTGNPALNANDFQCFLNAYAVGCT